MNINYDLLNVLHFPVATISFKFLNYLDSVERINCEPFWIEGLVYFLSRKVSIKEFTIKISFLSEIFRSILGFNWSTYGHHLSQS